MKKIVYFILISRLLLIFPDSFALETEYNTESNIKKAILVEDYIIKHKERIDNFLLNYNLTNNVELYNDIKLINESIDALRKIQNTNIEKKKAEEIIQAVLNRIRNINEDLKIKFKEGKEKYDIKLNQRKLAYSILGKKISDKIYNINLIIARSIIKDNNSLSIKELKIKDNLINLNKESQKLRNFGDMYFSTEKEIKDAFVKILKNIKIEVSTMNETLK